MLHLISRKIHVLVVLHESLERLLLGDEGFGRLGGRSRAGPSDRSLAPTVIPLTARSIPNRTTFISLLNMLLQTTL